jgi:hypothetical protein
MPKALALQNRFGICSQDFCKSNSAHRLRGTTLSRVELNDDPCQRSYRPSGGRAGPKISSNPVYELHPDVSDTDDVGRQEVDGAARVPGRSLVSAGKRVLCVLTQRLQQKESTVEARALPKQWNPLVRISAPRRPSLWACLLREVDPASRVFTNS